MLTATFSVSLVVGFDTGVVAGFHMRGYFLSIQAEQNSMAFPAKAPDERNGHVNDQSHRLALRVSKCSNGTVFQQTLKGKARAGSKYGSCKYSRAGHFLYRHRAGRT